VNAYGKQAFCFMENNIKVTIPFERLSDGGNVPVKSKKAPVDDVNTSVTTPVGDTNTPVTTPVTGTVGVSDKILEYCNESHGILEIAAHLGYKEKKTVRKYLTPLLEQGRIAMTVPEKPNSRLQKYITIK